MDDTILLKDERTGDDASDPEPSGIMNSLNFDCCAP
jgi:hypothetical protein